MDKLEKALQKLSSAEREKVREILEKLAAGNAEHLDVKKLKGRNEVFRVRKGSVRIIYRVDGSKTFVVAIERRGKNTYKNL